MIVIMNIATEEDAVSFVHLLLSKFQLDILRLLVLV